VDRAGKWEYAKEIDLRWKRLNNVAIPIGQNSKHDGLRRGQNYCINFLFSFPARSYYNAAANDDSSFLYSFVG
jgi:hypothetical protein